MFGTLGYQDRDMAVGLSLLNECFDAVPVTFSEWPKLKIKGGGKPRGLSVNEGRKYDFLD